MATVFENIPLKGIRRADLAQLLTYIRWAEEGGTYYGNREQFNARHERLKEWVGDAVEYAYSEGVKTPRPRKDQPK